MLALVLGTGCSVPLLAFDPFFPPQATPAKPASQPPSESPSAQRDEPSGPPTEAVRLPVAQTPPATTPAESNQLIFEWKYTLNHTSIKGNRERSFLHPGRNHIAEFNTYLNRGVFGVRRLESALLFRYTNDPRVDPERNSMQRGYTRLKGPTFEVSLGDSMASYSRFTMNQNVKGAHGWKELPRLGLRLMATAGTFSNRWGELFRSFEKFRDPRLPLDPQFPPKPYTRLVLGLRAERKIGANNFVAVNFSQGSDVIRSLPRQTLLLPFNNKVLSLDGALRRGAWQAAAEFAYSLTQFDARIQRAASKDYAARAEVSHHWGRLTWRADYARFMPNFFSVNARQVQDLQDVSARASYDLTRHIMLSGSIRRTNDNLPGRPVVALDGLGVLRVLTNRGRTLGIGSELEQFDEVVDANGVHTTTTVRQPELRLSIRGLPPEGRLQLNLGYRERQFHTSNKASFAPATGQPLFSDRDTLMPFLDLELRLKSSLFTLGYEHRDNIDHVRPVNSTRTHRFVASYRGTYFLGNFTLSPTLRFETEREAKELAGARSPHDQTRSIHGSLILDFPKYYSLEIFYRELNAALISPVPRDPLVLFGNAGFRRPYFRAAFTYKIRNSEDHYVVVSLERSVNSFRNPDRTQPDLLSFRENVFQITFFYRFRR